MGGFLLRSRKDIPLRRDISTRFLPALAAIHRQTSSRSRRRAYDGSQSSVIRGTIPNRLSLLFLSPSEVSHEDSPPGRRQSYLPACRRQRPLASGAKRLGPSQSRVHVRLIALQLRRNRRHDRVRAAQIVLGHRGDLLTLRYCVEPAEAVTDGLEKLRAPWINATEKTAVMPASTPLTQPEALSTTTCSEDNAAARCRENGRNQEPRLAGQGLVLRSDMGLPFPERGEDSAICPENVTMAAGQDWGKAERRHHVSVTLR
jgi:hypothetical protein